MKSTPLSRRERQILDALYALGQGSAAQVRDAVANPPSYTAIRTHLTNLEAKGAVRSVSDGVRYIYEPVVPKDDIGLETLQGVVSTFFGGRLDLVVSALIPKLDAAVSDEELARIAEIIEQARKEGR